MDSLPVEIEHLRKEIAALGNRLENLSKEKEFAYKEKKSVENLLSASISAAKLLKDQKLAIDEKVKEKKLQRTSLNKELKEFSKTAVPKQKSKVNPAGVKKQIEVMQYAIETEGLSFEREQTYMAKIKQLKAQLAELGYSTEEGQKAGTIKKQADSLHNDVQTFANQSAAIFEELTKKAKEISELKQKRAVLQEKLRSSKAEIDSLNLQMTEHLALWLEKTKSMPIAATVQKTSAKEDFDNIISKFKNAKRLTKEDILKLQRFSNKR